MFLERDLQFLCHQHQIGQRCGRHLSHHIAAMDLHRDLTDADFEGDLLVHAAGYHESHHLALALRQGIETGPEQADGLFILARRARSRSRPNWIASSRSWSRNGLVMNSSAPPFIACTDIGISPWPVMKMIGR